MVEASDQKEFTCSSCQVEFPFTYYSNRLRRCDALILLENAYIYVERSRESERQTNIPLILGSRCDLCRKDVCHSKACSLFYTKRYCRDCFVSNADSFPSELQKVFL
mmetsp:Transcript_1802/g.2632  ORF Transcript_1802/g.2632 Transcript_1802/m.2632 type:complete len:107 (+) Transcript_1802:27-347(+)